MHEKYLYWFSKLGSILKYPPGTKSRLIIQIISMLERVSQRTQVIYILIDSAICSGLTYATTSGRDGFTEDFLVFWI